MLRDGIRVHQINDLLISIFQFHVKLLRKFDQCDLIRTCCLKLLLGLIVSIGVNWCDIMAQ